MKLSVNAQQTLENLTAFFSESTSFVHEAFQNSCRAAANSVSVEITSSKNESSNVAKIKFMDDGKGITGKEWQSLFSLSESGWDEDTKKNQTPFGAGFFSLILAAKHTSIRSNGKRLSLKKEQALAGKDFGSPVASNAAPVRGTEVILKELDIALSSLRYEIEKLALSFPCDINLYVTIDGEPMKLINKSSMSFGAIRCNPNYQQVNLDTGALFLPNLDTPEKVFRFSEIHKLEVSLIAQNKLLSQSSGNYSSTDLQPIYYANTDSSGYQLRMPDRSAFVDHSNVENKIKLTAKKALGEMISKTINTSSQGDLKNGWTDKLASNSFRDINNPDEWIHLLRNLSRFTAGSTDIEVAPLFDINVDNTGEATRNFIGFYTDTNQAEALVTNSIAQGVVELVSLAKGIPFSVINEYEFDEECWAYGKPNIHILTSDANNTGVVAENAEECVVHGQFATLTLLASNEGCMTVKTDLQSLQGDSCEKITLKAPLCHYGAMNDAFGEYQGVLIAKSEKDAKERIESFSNITHDSFCELEVMHRDNEEGLEIREAFELVYSGVAGCKEEIRMSLVNEQLEDLLSRDGLNSLLDGKVMELNERGVLVLTDKSVQAS